MPTGYTAKIADGIDFRTYAMDCARAFGACVTLRDEAGGGEVIPEKFEPRDWNAKCLAEALNESQRLAAMTAAECEEAAEAAWEEAEASRVNRLNGYRDLRAKYERMLSEVEAWNPPTSDHEKFRNFMRDQIVQSIDCDCCEEYASTPEQRLSGEQWRAKMAAKASNDIEYHAAEDAKERERAEGRTAWVSALRASLPT